MEYVNGGEIFFHLYNDKRFSEDRTRFYVAEISLALKYLHGQGIICGSRHPHPEPPHPNLADSGRVMSPRRSMGHTRPPTPPPTRSTTRAACIIARS